MGKRKRLGKDFASPLLPLWPQFVPRLPLTGKGREGTGGPVYLVQCTTLCAQLTVRSSSAHCAQTCVLLYSSGKVSVVCRGVTLAPRAHPTANVVSQGKAPSLPKSVQIWLIGRDISQNSKNSSLNPWPFFIWMLLGKISIPWECIYFAEHQSKVKALKLGFASSSVDMSWQ